MATDLADLSRKWGGYDRIPPHAWAEYDASVAAYHCEDARRARWEELVNRLLALRGQPPVDYFGRPKEPVPFENKPPAAAERGGR